MSDKKKTEKRFAKWKRLQVSMKFMVKFIRTTIGLKVELKVFIQALMDWLETW